MKIHQIITEDPQVLSTLDAAGNYQVKLDNGNIKTFPDRASAETWARDPKNIAKSRFDKPDIDPATGKPRPGLNAPTDKQRAAWNKLTPEERKKRREKRKAGRNKFSNMLKIATPWNAAGWKPAGIGGWAVALLTLVGAYQLARSWWAHTSTLLLHAKNEHPSIELENWQEANSNLAGDYDPNKVTPQQIYTAITDSEATPEAMSQFWSEAQEYAKTIVAPEVAVIAATWIVSVKSNGIVMQKFAKLLQTGMAAGGALTAGGIALGVLGTPAWLAAGSMLFGAVAAELLVGAMMAFLSTDTGKQFTEKVILWAMGALFDEAKEIATGINILNKSTKDTPEKRPGSNPGPAQSSQPAQQPNQDLSADDVRRQLGIR